MKDEFDIHAMAEDLETAAEFLTRKRGRVRARWVMVPIAACWFVAAGIAVVVGRQHRPELVPFTAGLYVCTAFFVHAYVVAWRSGNVIWRYAALGVATLFYVVLCYLHADDAGAWLIYTESGVTARPPEPRLFVAVVLDAIAVLLLLVHGFFLGLGSHAPRAAASSTGQRATVSGADDAPAADEPPTEDRLGEPGTPADDDASPGTDRDL